MSNYEFVSTDAKALEAQLVEGYEHITGVTVAPASPEKLFIQWVLSIILHERALENYIGNQNIPSRASGDNLDALGELFYEVERPEAKRATCMERFYISTQQPTAVLIPAGTRLGDASNQLIWETIEDAYVPIGETSVDVPIRCQTPGVIGNGYALGQIKNLVDLYDWYERCENITVSDGGSDRATDEEYYKLLRASADGYSCAGSTGGYAYFAQRASTEIIHVVANSPSPGAVDLYALMRNHEPASTEVKKAILAACTQAKVRPLTDHVSVKDPEKVKYNIAFTYYVPRNIISSGDPMHAPDLEAAVDAAVKEYVNWQASRLGRDINPSVLVGMLMQTGIKRVEMTGPTYTELRDGLDNTVPQLASVGEISVINGGFEDE